LNNWKKPRRFDRNLVVIGAGAGGLVTAYIAAAVKARVTLIEGHRMGGDCLNTGCVPSKALIRAARFMKTLREAESLGITNARAEADFGRIMARVRDVVRQVEPHDSVERYTQLGVEVIRGRARITSPWTVEVMTETGDLATAHPERISLNLPSPPAPPPHAGEGCAVAREREAGIPVSGQINKQILTTRAIVIATGAAPIIPKIPGIESVRHVTSDTVWSLAEKPERLVVLGGGPIGCELAQAFAALGSRVTLVARSGILGKEDADAVALVEAGMRADGVKLLTGADTPRCELVDGEQRLVIRKDGVEEAIPFDVLLCATGRKARVTGFGLEELGIATTRQGTIEVNEYLQTRYPHIYACGDVAGPYQFTHTAAHQAWYAAVNALFGGLFGSLWRFKADYRVVPWVTFTSPEVARVGLSEAEARAQGIAYEVTRYSLDDLDRAITDGAAHGFVKVLTPPGKDRILGATIVGEHAGEMLAEFTLAMKHGLGLNKILGTIHPYPTWSEAAKYAAGEWKRAHAPRGLLAWLERFHAWRRG
jgi:pyruvate/2-oxoglutarate dehydrogenase complex dihydrolipoamide dehydrogenase (E3) component